MKLTFANNLATLAVTVMLAGSATLGKADDGNTDRNNQFDFALIGDVPYSPTFKVPSGTSVFLNYQVYPSAQYEAMIADINAHSKVLFTIHVGDIKEGNTWCQGGNSLDLPLATNVYAKNLEYFNSFRTAVVYLPGDNEWTDCHRVTNGGYNPSERLAYIRGTSPNNANQPAFPGFFASNLSLGQRPISLVRQSSDPLFSLYKENVRWRAGNIIFVGLNQPGSNNNHGRTTGPFFAETEAEYAARNAANLAWVTAAFAAADADPATKGIVIMQQANVFERFQETTAKSGYEDFVTLLRNKTIAFGKPVVLVGGDTHTVRIDKPLTALRADDGTFLSFGGNYLGYPGYQPKSNTLVTATTMFDTTTGAVCTTASSTCLLPNRVQNFTRVEVFGSPDVAWIRGVVDPFDPNVLSFSMQTLPGTGHGHVEVDDTNDQ